MIDVIYTDIHAIAVLPSFFEIIHFVLRAESKTADKIEEKEGIVLRLDTKLYNYPLGKINGRRYQISGKTDRVMHRNI